MRISRRLSRTRARRARVARRRRDPQRPRPRRLRVPRRARPRAAAAWLPGANTPVSEGISTMRLGFNPSTVLVPCSTVTGRSVLSRSVKQGIPRNVVSSCTPPESVSTAAASASSEKSRSTRRVHDLDSAAVPRRVQHLLGPWMGRKSNRQASAHLLELLHHLAEKWSVHQSRPVQCHQQVLSRGEAAGFGGSALAEYRLQPHQRVDHGVPHEVDSLPGDASRLKLSIASSE